MAVFTEELTSGSKKHQLNFSLPTHFAGNGNGRVKGFGDVQIEYNYALIGNNTSRLTISPGIGLNLPTGSARKEWGADSVGVAFKVPVSMMLAKRFVFNSVVEVAFTKSARNPSGERADTIDYEIGQSFVWFAKPKLNFLVEAVWERSQEVVGQVLKEYEREFVISPGVRWAYIFENDLTVLPGVAVPLGVGPNRGENRIFFYISFEHSIRKER